MEHVYVAERASGFNFTVIFPRKKKRDKEVRVRVRFEKGQFKTDDDKLAKAIDLLLATKPSISRNCRKADQAAALKLALRHKALMDRTGAHKGSVTADATKRAMTTALEERDKELREYNVDEKAFADESLQLTETIEPTKTEVEEVETEAVVEPAVFVQPILKEKKVLLLGGVK